MQQLSYKAGFLKNSALYIEKHFYKKQTEFRAYDNLTTEDVVKRAGLICFRVAMILTAIDSFDIEVKGKVCIDCGASTGGFTDCLLQNGADHVFGIDVGSGQMNTKLRLNPKVTCIEKINARRLDDLIRTNLLPAFDPTPNLVVVDIINNMN